MIDLDTTVAKQERVTESRIREIHKISFLSKEEELYINDLTDPLVNLAKDMPTFGSELHSVLEGVDEPHKISLKIDPSEEKWYQSSESDESELEESEENYDFGRRNETFYTKGSKYNGK